MIDKDNAAMLSQLVDGELGSDETNRLLLKALRNSESRVELLRMLQLRHALAPWRSHGEDSLEIKPMRSTLHAGSKYRNALIAVAAALVVSVSAWVYNIAVPNGLDLGGAESGRSTDRQVASSLSSKDAARILRLHESITGPVAWLAILPDSVQVQKTRAVGVHSQPIACFLNIQSQIDGDFPTTPDLIICRLEEKVVLSIPSGTTQSKAMRIQLVAVRREGSLGLQYAISLEDRLPNESQTATLTGFMPLRENSRAIGQLAHAGTTLDVALRASLLTFEPNG